MLIKYLLNGKEINLTSDNININSNNFNVDKNGNMTCNNATISNVKVQNGSIELSTKGLNVLQVHADNDISERIYINEQYFGIQLSGYKDIISMGNIDKNEGIIELFGNGVTAVKASGIETPKVTQTSVESIKKNISIYNENALETILNSDIYTYNLKTENDTDKKHIGFVIGEKYKTQKEIINNEGNAIELYSAIGILWKGMQEHIQEQQMIIGQLQGKIKEMEEKTNGKDSI